MLGRDYVTSIEIGLITAIIALATMIQVYATFRIVQIAASTIVSHVQSLDGAIAEAIQSVVEQGIGGIEPPNPIVGIITEYLKANTPQGTAEMTVLKRDDEGKFLQKEE